MAVAPRPVARRRKALLDRTAGKASGSLPDFGRNSLERAQITDLTAVIAVVHDQPPDRSGNGQVGARSSRLQVIVAPRQRRPDTGVGVEEPLNRRAPPLFG